MRTVSIAITACLATLAAADDPSKAGSPAAKLAALRKEVKELGDEFYKAVEKLEDTKEGQNAQSKLFKECEEKQVKRYEAALELANADSKSDVAFEAVEWLLTTPRVYHLSVGKPVLEFALKQYAADPRIGKAVLRVSQCDPLAMYPNHKLLWEFVAAVGKENPDKTARAQAVLAQAWKAKEKFEGAEYKKEKDAGDLATAAEKAFERVIAEYEDCKLLGRLENVTVGDRAKLELFELRNLRVGKTAPDIAGEDLDGVKFKLSDYRGKVVVLSFWGDW